MFDTLILGSFVVDGTGKPGIEADIGIRGDTIAAIGKNQSDVEAHEIVDGRGFVVTPGFIDIHTHSDYSLLLNRKAESSVMQGVTIELTGNCGMGCAPIKPSVDLPLVVLEYQPGINRTWHSFGEWLEALESGGLSINIAALAAHGPVRMSVIGASEREASSSELEEMTSLIERSMDEGAFGFSSGLEYTPGKNAGQKELTALAATAGRYGGLYATHIRNRDYQYRSAIQEAVETAAAAEVSLQISHIAPRWGSTPGSAGWALEQIDKANREGIAVWFDNHPYTQGRGLVMSTFPASLFEGGRERLRERLKDRALRRVMYENINPQWKFAKENRWDLLVLFEAPNNRQFEGKTIAEIADITGDHPWDVVCDLLEAEWENPSALYWSAPIHKQEDVDISFQHPRGIVMSDGSAIAPHGPYAGVKHVYAYSWVAYFLRRYFREAQLLTLEEAIHKMSGLPAQRLGLSNRGTIKPGNKADLVLLDPTSIQDNATFEHPVGFPSGIKRVWINGVLTVADGIHTGAKAGNVLRRNS